MHGEPVEDQRDLLGTGTQALGTISRNTPEGRNDAIRLTYPGIYGWARPEHGVWPAGRGAGGRAVSGAAEAFLAWRSAICSSRFSRASA